IDVDLDAVPPSPPRDLAAAPGAGSVDLSWSAPEDAGTTPVTGYEVALDDRSFVVGANIGSMTVQPLDPGVEVAFRVRALSASGASPWADAPVVAPGPGENLFSDVEWGHQFHRE